MDDFHGIQTGFVVQCEGGYIKGGAAFDPQGTQIKTFTRTQPDCKQNFIDVVRSRKMRDLRTDALEGHLSCGLVHMANISYRVGRHKPNEEICEVIRSEAELDESFERLNEHLNANRLNLGRKSLTLGAMLTMDRDKERFVGPMSEQANQFISGKYGKPFVVPNNV